MDTTSWMYNVFMFPFEILGIRHMRKQLLPLASGNVLEIGVGTGANLSMLPGNGVTRFTGIDLDRLRVKRPSHIAASIPFQFDQGDVERLPYADDHFDTVLFTLVFCSVRDPHQGLSEVHRVLKPGGRLIFIEHILPQQGRLHTLFHKLTPYWKRMANGCHLNRETLTLLEERGFELENRHYFFNNIFVGGTAIKNKKTDTH